MEDIYVALDNTDLENEVSVAEQSVNLFSTDMQSEKLFRWTYIRTRKIVLISNHSSLQITIKRKQMKKVRKQED